MIHYGNIRIVVLGCVVAVCHSQLFVAGKDAPANAVWNNVLDVQSKESERETATPLFWHIHKAGGTTLHDYFGTCLNLTIAAEVGVAEGHNMDTELAQVIVLGRKYINVDTTTDEGIQRAAKLGFRNTRHLAEVVITPLILPVTELLFSKENRAIMFTLLRHPVDRTISMFYYLQTATWEPTYTARWATMTLMDYINSEIIESNWMVRFLVGKPTGSVDEHDLEEAKKILRDKCWIGLQIRMEESISRFGQLFAWDRHPKWSTCLAHLKEGKARSNSNARKAPISTNSDEWHMLEQINSLDLKLFAYAHKLYSEQGKTYFPQYQAVPA